MSTAKYTPGPWEEVELFIVTPSDSVICKLGGWDAEHAEEQAANAQLIAAAPELMTWLRWSLKHLSDDKKQSAQYDWACAVLLKAGGEKL